MKTKIMAVVLMAGASAFAQSQFEPVSSHYCAGGASSRIRCLSCLKPLKKICLTTISSVG